MFTKYDCLYCVLIHKEIVLLENCTRNHQHLGQNLESYQAYIDNLFYDRKEVKR